MPELKQYNLRYRRRKNRYVNDLQVGVCSWLFHAVQCQQPQTRLQGWRLRKTIFNDAMAREVLKS